MLLYFPSMHLEFASAETPPEVCFLDPGFAEQTDGRSVRPTGLPMDERSAKAFVQESLRFGEQFPNIKDLSYHAVGKQENCFDHTSMAIRSELRARIEGVSTENDFASKARAQSLLLLAYSLEQRVLEVDACQEGVQSGHDKLAMALGFSEDDFEEMREMGLQDALEIPQEPAPLSSTWRNVFEAMLLLTGCADYYTDDPQVLADLEEQGLVGAGYGHGTFKIPAWKVLGLSKADAKRPWLNGEISVSYSQKALI
ncbi:hypothetical protein PCS_00502 [Desulfocurvibacter africanus PCS]|uniref:Uncharacterized protein n=1 Tax=Desulfocurvibacter africanus PCS TaxID=1262666 RepID=M5Q2X9_DESAF|nr:hypothetical protein [Desulfocurvibacter africanus]EMG38866.1 hypothetical protein PCS_00502 [Desulfocurvibacter africanus PCS]